VSRRATGQLVVRRRAGGVVFGARFRAGGERHYVTLGRSVDGMTEARAREELANVLADVRRGIWRPPAAEPVVEPSRAEPTFHAYASEWVERRRFEVGERTAEHWRWALSCHLLPYFAGYRPSEVSGRLVDGYKAAALREREEAERAHAADPRVPLRGLSPSSINKTLKVLAQILDDAVEDGLLAENPARGKRRRLRAGKPRRTWLEADEVAVLVEAAGGHRALIATMVLSGLRVSEMAELRWRDVDLAGRRLRVAESKTDAGVRTVDLSPWLAEELATHRASARFTAAADFVFATRNGTRRQRSNVTRQILGPAIVAANERLRRDGRPELAGVTNHSLRRTFASLLYEAGASPAYVMAQMGHASSALALEVYARKMERSRDTGARMDALVRPADWAPTGTSLDSVAAEDNLRV
jgi:integrase